MLTDRHKTGAHETCRNHRALTVTATDGTALNAVLHGVAHDVAHDVASIRS